MKIVLEFKIAFVEGSSPHHAALPVLRRVAPSEGTIRLDQHGLVWYADLELEQPGASFVLSLRGRDYFDQEVTFGLLSLGSLVQPVMPHPTIRRIASRTEGGQPVFSLEVMTPRLKEVAGPGASISPTQLVFDLPDAPLGAFPRKSVNPGNGVLPPKDTSGFLAGAMDVSTAPARLRYFEVRKGHALIAAYVPWRALPTAGDYLMFFKPPRHNDATPKQVVEGYVSVDAFSTMCLMGAMEQSRTTAIGLLLVGEAGSVPARLVTGDGIAELVLEIDAYLRTGNPYLVGSGVRSVALAGFSQGGEFLASTLSRVDSSRLAPFLKAVFVLDCFFPGGEEPFKRDLRKWFNNGDGRAIRSYHGHTVHRCDLFGDQPGFEGEEGTASRQVRYGHPAGVPDYSWLHLSEAFFRHRCEALATSTDLHHAIPKLFLPHALRTAGMAQIGL